MGVRFMVIRVKGNLILLPHAKIPLTYPIHNKFNGGYNDN